MSMMMSNVSAVVFCADFVNARIRLVEIECGELAHAKADAESKERSVADRLRAASDRHSALETDKKELQQRIASLERVLHERQVLCHCVVCVRAGVCVCECVCARLCMCSEVCDCTSDDEFRTLCLV